MTTFSSWAENKNLYLKLFHNWRGGGVINVHANATHTHTSARGVCKTLNKLSFQSDYFLFDKTWIFIVLVQLSSFIQSFVFNKRLLSWPESWWIWNVSPEHWVEDGNTANPHTACLRIEKEKPRKPGRNPHRLETGKKHSKVSGSDRGDVRWRNTTYSITARGIFNYCWGVLNVSFYKLKLVLCSFFFSRIVSDASI